MPTAVQPQWIAVDWGTTNMRAFALQGADRVLARSDGPGLSDLTGGGPPAFDEALRLAIEPWLGDATMPVVMCGMVGSRQGWKEAPYLKTPASLFEIGNRLVPVSSADPRLRAAIVPGLAQSAPPDVMRGEETQLLGVLRECGDRAPICLPGTHSKWAFVKDGTVERFSTAMTGELFSLLRERSILRHSMAPTDHMDPDAFAAAVKRSFRAPQDLMTALFGVRARTLLQASQDAEAMAELSGLLLGAEFAGALPHDVDHVVLVGEPKLTGTYAQGLKALGRSSSEHDGSDAAIRGLATVSGVLESSLKVPA
ncbi:MAG: 2-dehydro-3-deoxygalactonokinase [Pseudomonadota bacterium]